MNSFQVIVTGIFIFFIVLGVLVFASFGGLGGGENVGKVVIWGVVDERIFDRLFTDLSAVDDAFDEVTYIQKKPETYTQELVDAIASGNAPDLFLLPQDSIVELSDKIQPIAFSVLSERRFQDAFIDEGSLYLSPQGILGFPLIIDPMVMYYNRDIFAAGAIAEVPEFWEELFTIAPKLTSLDNASNVKRSAVALGEYRNVRHAKEILSLLFLQAGDRITAYNAEGKLVSVLGEQKETLVNPAESALRFYTEFSNPVKSVYSWNRALPDSGSAFTAGDLGVYFGFASEYESIRSRNPNLSFGVAVLPQARDGKNRYTFGKMQALSIPRGAQNVKGAVIVAQKLSAEGPARAIAEGIRLPPVRRDLLVEDPANALQSVFVESAILSRGWYDPKPQGSADAFRAMVESVTSGRLRLGEAIGDASGELAKLLE